MQKKCYYLHSFDQHQQKPSGMSIKMASTNTVTAYYKLIGFIDSIGSLLDDPLTLLISDLPQKANMKDVTYIENTSPIFNISPTL